ncbi:MAG TPA: beta-N-acetylhexosaminidase [Dongiaceae bacterium]|jgi:beta-N-acetylhexosaminidase
MTAPLACIFGCGGVALTDDERRLYRDSNPLGFILFQRNCQTPDQIRALIAEMRRCVGRADAPVLIDQEGGRVQRLKPPVWRKAPAAAVIGDLARRSLSRAIEAARLNARLIAEELASLGFTADCAPVLDLRLAITHQAIGDRAYSDDPAVVSALGRAACEGFIAGGIIPVPKHMPGHGRAVCDSHIELPRVSASADELERTDFAPFHALRDMPWAMTAHILFTALDPSAPATASKVVIDKVIRGSIGFQGLLFSDDLSMQALEGTLRQRAERALAAGCDVALHCNGSMDEMRQIAEGIAPLTPAALERVATGRRLLNGGERIDIAAAQARFDALMAA